MCWRGSQCVCRLRETVFFNHTRKKNTQNFYPPWQKNALWPLCPVRAPDKGDHDALCVQTVLGKLSACAARQHTLWASRRPRGSRPFPEVACDLDRALCWDGGLRAAEAGGVHTSLAAGYTDWVATVFTYMYLNLLTGWLADQIFQIWALIINEIIRSLDVLKFSFLFFFFKDAYYESWM